MSKIDVLLGLQWGDEGKGKVVDVLTPNYQLVARFQGGPNAGHTLVFEDRKHVLHTVPSGIFRNSAKNLIGNGVVIDPIVLQKELRALHENGVDTKNRLMISEKAHLILPTHRMLDAASEKAKGKDKIGSTLKGIGPAYMDKTGRNGLRIGDTRQLNFREKYDALKTKHLQLLKAYDITTDESFLQEEQAWFAAIAAISELPLVSGEYYIHECLQKQQRILAEGAQGSLLDIDFGTYPYVTSSNTTCAGACTGLGLPPSAIGNVIGIFKAYCTRVGSGPFPTELHDETGNSIREKGKEFGSTTGRPRRCGWLDLPALKFACMINGITELIMMKSDVLGGLPKIQVCTSYKIEGRVQDTLPYQFENQKEEPVYKELEGWGNLDQVKYFRDLPASLQQYIRLIEDYVQVPVTLVSTGPGREQTLFR